jgi:hypothetical protein
MSLGAEQCESWSPFRSHNVRHSIQHGACWLTIVKDRHWDHRLTVCSQFDANHDTHRSPRPTGLGARSRVCEVSSLCWKSSEHAGCEPRLAMRSWKNNYPSQVNNLLFNSVTVNWKSIWRMPSSGMWSRVALVRTDVVEEHMPPSSRWRESVSQEH